MKLNLTVIFRFIIVLTIVLGLATFLSPANSTPTGKKVNDIKIEKQHSDLIIENTSEMLHGKILFKY